MNFLKGILFNVIALPIAVLAVLFSIATILSLSIIDKTERLLYGTRECRDSYLNSLRNAINEIK